MLPAQSHLTVHKRAETTATPFSLVTVTVRFRVGAGRSGEMLCDDEEGEEGEEVCAGDGMTHNAASAIKNAPFAVGPWPCMVRVWNHSGRPASGLSGSR